MKKRMCFVMLMVLAILLAMVVFRSSRQSGDAFRIGAILPLTGPMSFLGGPELYGLQAAVDEYNQRPDRLKNVELVIEDSKGEAKSAVVAAQRLCGIGGVDAVITSCSGVSKAVSPVFKKAKIPMFALCSDTTISEENDTSVNFYVNLDAEQRALAEHFRRVGVKEIAVLRINAEAGTLAARLLKKYCPELKFVEEWTYDLDRTDFKDIAASIRASTCENVYIVGLGIRFAAILQAFQSCGVRKRLFGNYMFLSAGSAMAPIDMLSKVTFTAFPVLPEGLEGTALGSYFKKRGKPMPAFMDYVFTYDAVRFITQKYIQDGLSTGVSCRCTTFESLFGSMDIPKDGNAVIPMKLGRYTTEGKVVLINE